MPNGPNEQKRPGDIIGAVIMVAVTLRLEPTARQNGNSWHLSGRTARDASSPTLFRAWASLPISDITAGGATNGPAFAEACTRRG